MKFTQDEVLALARDNIKLFSSVTGIRLSIVEKTGDNQLPCGQKGCDFCKWLDMQGNRSIDCHSVVREAGYRSLKLEGKYVFFCLTSFIHLVVPIFMNNSLAGVAVSEPICIKGSDEKVAAEILTRFELEQGKREELIKRLKSLPHMPLGKVRAATELLYRLVTVLPHIHYSLEEVQSESVLPPHFFRNIEKELLSYIQDGRKDDTFAIINSAFLTFVTYLGDEMALLRNLTLELTLLLSQLASQHGLLDDNVYGPEYELLHKLEKADSIGMLKDCIDEIAEEFIGIAFNISPVRQSSVISAATAYIQQNYMTKLSLDSVASHVYLSPSYLSRIFKESVGCNFSTYLNRIRIHHAKEFLANENIELMNIASLTGFEDQSYFTKVFKRVTNMTPKKYREMNRK